MRRAIVTLAAYALGIAVISISSVVIYQQLTMVPVVQVLPPPPVPEPQEVTVPPRVLELLEPMETEDYKPSGRLLSMPKTGRE